MAVCQYYRYTISIRKKMNSHNMKIKIHFPIFKEEEGLLPLFLPFKYSIMFHEMSNLKHNLPKCWSNTCMRTSKYVQGYIIWELTRPIKFLCFWQRADPQIILYLSWFIKGHRVSIKKSFLAVHSIFKKWRFCFCCCLK